MQLMIRGGSRFSLIQSITSLIDRLFQSYEKELTYRIPSNKSDLIHSKSVTQSNKKELHVSARVRFQQSVERLPIARRVFVIMP